MNLDDFDKLSLPKASSQEDLETIARTKLRLLFPIELFEIRDILQRDKGVDVVVELKRNGYATNFNFVVQLKGTASISPNGDGSFSLSVAISNVNYLANHPLPSYYILYDDRLEEFLFEDAAVANQYVENLAKAGTDQQSITVRFNKRLTPEALQEIYQSTFRKGLLFRELNSVLNFDPIKATTPGNVVIRGGSNIHSVSVSYDELITEGLELLNKGLFGKVIDLERRCQPLDNPSGAFHFICGVAHYHCSDMLRAMTHFKEAKGKISDIDGMQAGLRYYDEMARYAIGRSDQKAFDEAMSEIAKDPYVGLYLKMNAAYRDFLIGDEDTKARFEVYHNSIEEIKDHPAANAHIRLMADGKLLTAEGFLINETLEKHMHLIRAVKDGRFQVRADLSDLFKAMYEFDRRIERWRDRATEEINDLGSYGIILDHVRYSYRNYIYLHYIPYFNSETSEVPFTLTEVDQELIEEQCKFLDKITEDFQLHSSLDSIPASQSLKYQLLHFAGRFDEAEIAKEKLRSLIEHVDLPEMTRKLNRLINGGTEHELYRQALIRFFAGQSKA